MIFIPSLQPIVYGHTSEILAYEILARWQNSQGQILTPGQLKAVPEWHDVDINTLELIEKHSSKMTGIVPRLFMNVSENTISSKNLFADWIQRVEKVLENASFALVIEITEVVSDEALRRCWPELRRLGAKLALDDYGDENSHRSRLISFDWDYCKFEANLLDEEYTREAIKYCKDAGILPIAERIEDEDTSIVCLDCGLAWQQGFWHSNPKLLPELLGMSNLLFNTQKPATISFNKNILTRTA